MGVEAEPSCAGCVVSDLRGASLTEHPAEPPSRQSHFILTTAIPNEHSKCVLVFPTDEIAQGSQLASDRAWTKPRY